MDYETIKAARSRVRLLASRLRVAGKNEDAVRAADACDLLVDELEQRLLPQIGPARQEDGQRAELARLQAQAEVATRALQDIQASAGQYPVPVVTRVTELLAGTVSGPRRPTPIEQYERTRTPARPRSILLAVA